MNNTADRPIASPKPMQEILKLYSVTIETPVAWGEMDAFQHVNNIVYFRYFESARILSWIDL